MILLVGINRHDLDHLDQCEVDAPSINSFKTKLEQIQETRMGFYGLPLTL